MSWKELLQRDSPQEDPRALPSDGDLRGRGSLIQQVCSLVGISGTAEAGVPERSGGETEVVRCRDGYARRSPVQPYRTPEDFQRRRVRKALLILAVLVIAVLLVLTVLKIKLFSF